MIAEGQVRVSAVLEGGRLAAVRATTDRPLIGDLLLRGRAPAEAPGLLSLALSLCGRSQAVVCAAACEAAGATRQQQAVSEHRSRELAAETVQEHAWRLTLDWPRLAGEPEDMELLGRMRALARSAPASDAAWGAARDALLSLVSSRLLGERADGWLESRSASDWLAWAEMARGLLTHVVEIADGRIARYAIVAPTEWNFHPAGALPAALEGAVAADDEQARRLLEATASALDPCVALSVELRHA